MDASLGITSRLLRNYHAMLCIAINLLAEDFAKVGAERPMVRRGTPTLGKDGFSEQEEVVQGYQQQLRMLVAITQQIESDAEFFSNL